jgi:hypothetical protein
MKRVYVAGPYSGRDVLTVLANIGDGRNAAALVFAAGYAPFVPWHDADFYERLTPTERAGIDVGLFKQQSMEWLEVADIVAVLPRWRESPGTIAERARAEELGIPVFEMDAKALEHRNTHTISQQIEAAMRGEAVV